MDRAPRFQVASEPTGRNPQAADEKEDVAQRMLVRVAVGLGLLALLFFGMMTKPTREQFLDWIKGRQSGQPELKMT